MLPLGIEDCDAVVASEVGGADGVQAANNSVMRTSQVAVCWAVRFMVDLLSKMSVGMGVESPD